MEEYINNFIINKPWGEFEQYTHNQISTVKIISVNPNQRLSLQSHNHRSELWIPLTSDCVVEIDDKTLTPNQYDKVFIPQGSKHRLSAKENPIKILEISFGNFDEEDIVRYEDDFGRN